MAAAFAPDVGAVERFGGGHINDTFLVDTAAGQLVVQRLNTTVFRDPEAVTANIAVVHRHLGGAGLPEPVPTADGPRREATLVRDFAEVPRDAERVVFFPPAAGG